jgi:hypothetical protein
VKAEGPKPFVCGARYPNGAIALAFLPRAAVGKGYVECLADVTLDAKLETGKPLGVFGRFRTLTLKGGIADGAHIQARQLPSGKARDVTTLCTIGEDGSVTIPLAILEKPQGAYTPNVVIKAVTMPKTGRARVPQGLPAAQLSEAEVVKAAVAELGATSKKDMGRVMKEVMARVKGQADGKLVSKLVGAALP